ncbi:MAG: helix-turn-helix domain-containing protein [Gammaproteobacteria bacterium]|nr:helix-turn-helix domain-containing protein [Gammaproteobacteria bacterium]
MSKYKKRNLFEELSLGIEEISEHKTGKLTLRTQKIEKKPVLKANAELIREIREKLHMSRNVFALKLRVSPRTLEKWEQGRAEPNVQAAALIRMVHKYPDTLQRLDEL